MACTDSKSFEDTWPEDPATTHDTGLEDSDIGEDTAVEEEEVEPALSRPAFYPDQQTHSPINTYVAENIREITSFNPQLEENLFIKIGASSTVSQNTLYCFADDNIDLGEYLYLEESLSFFLTGDANGTTPFDRDTIAARIGHSAGWAISGDPSPVEEELAIVPGKFALVHYGTNDMGLGSTYAAAMPGFYENMNDLIELLISEGVVPIITGITHRADSSNADLWVPSYNSVIRGMAQSWQIPFIDLWWETDPLDDWGLAGDGIHLNKYPYGTCLFTEEALQYGYNIRNLIVLEALDRVRQTAIEEITYIDEGVPFVQGEGSPDIPFTVHTLPFNDFRDTQQSPHDENDIYIECGSDADESGPEYHYTLILEQETPIRAMVLDRGVVDIDIHLFEENNGTKTCLERAHRIIERTLPAGTYHLILDSWVDGDQNQRSGEYLLSIIACESNDPRCQ